MRRYTSSELTALFENLQRFVSDSEMALEATSAEQACRQVVQAFF